MIPQSIAHYRITAKLGEGGMGEVYRATDTKLGRDVAIKVIPDAFAQDANRMARFAREAQVLASLNHPNIGAIYGVEESALVLELVEGPTLAERTAKGPMPAEEALPIARQIAEAVEYAHERGIIHRDLKPANIKLTPEGRVKVLDFGLAKLTEQGQTPVPALTQTMAITGTPGYLAPEQLQGKPADARSDIFAFGCVLYELLSGQRAFPGNTLAASLAATAMAEPKAIEGAPKELERLVRRCLRKDPARRIQHMDDVRVALEDLKEDSEPGGVSGAELRPAGSRPWLAWSVAAVLAVGLGPVAFLHFREKPPAPAAPLHFQIAAPGGAIASAYLSPDGRKLAFRAGDRLWVQFLESGESRDLTATDPAVPFWSPDSRFIGYPYRGKLKKIEATGGPPQTVTDLRGDYLWGGGAWNQDDVIVFGDRDLGLFRVPASGGVPVQITALDSARHENSQYCPSFLPDRRHFVYIRSSTDEGKSAIYLGSVDARPEQQSSTALVASNSQPVYAPSEDPGAGYLLFVQGVTLMAQPFDNRRLELKGQAAPVAERVRNNIAGTGASYASFSASANDVLVFPRISASGLQVTWFDREGKAMGTVGEPGAYGGLGNLELSPDGTRLALTKNTGGADAGNIWLLDLSRGGASTRFTFGSLVDMNPVWSPDGSRIIFSSNRDGTYNLYQKPANGVKDEEVLLKSSEDKQATSWSRDGRFLLYTVVHPKTKSDIWALPLEGGRKPVPYLVTEFNEGQARFSPNGHWVAYTSDESGNSEVYVRSFFMNFAGTAVEAGGKWPISNGSGTDPHWRGDGRELYYRSREGRLMAVEIATDPAFRAGNPQPLGVSAFASLWDSAADGRRFLGLTANSGPQPYTVVLNWQAGLKK